MEATNVQSDEVARVPSLTSPPTPTGSNGQVTNDYASTARTLNDIFSLGSGERMSAQRASSAATGSASRVGPGPSPVPEFHLPLPSEGDAVSPDFFISSKPKKRLRRAW